MGKSEGELLNLKRAPRLLYEKWKKNGVLPRNIDREIVEIMHRTHIGVDQDYKNLMKQGTRAAIADGWGGSMLATDLQDVLFGTPYPHPVGGQSRCDESRPRQSGHSWPRTDSVGDDRGRGPTA
jgi:hydroxylamine reductase (hybrid-cluster protein)